MAWKVSGGLVDGYQCNDVALSLSYQCLTAGDGGNRCVDSSPLPTQLKRLPHPQPQRLSQLFTSTNHTWLLMVRKPLRFITASSSPIVLDSCCRLTSHHGFLETNGDGGTWGRRRMWGRGTTPKSVFNQPLIQSTPERQSSNQPQIAKSAVSFAMLSVQYVADTAFIHSVRCSVVALLVVEKKEVEEHVKTPAWSGQVGKVKPGGTSAMVTSYHGYSAIKKGPWGDLSRSVETRASCTRPPPLPKNKTLSAAKREVC